MGHRPYTIDIDINLNIFLLATSADAWEPIGSDAALVGFIPPCALIEWAILRRRPIDTRPADAGPAALAQNQRGGGKGAYR